MLKEMLDEDYSDVDDPFVQRPQSINPVIKGSIVDEVDRNDVEMEGDEHDDFEFAKDFSSLIDNRTRVEDLPQDIVSNCQV